MKSDNQDPPSPAGDDLSRFERIFDSVPVGISLVSFHPDGRVTRLINDAHLRLCGITREEAEHSENFLRVSHPDDRALQAEFSRCIERGEIDSFSMEKRYVRPDGNLVWVMFTLNRRYLAADHYEDLTTVTDITERKQAEETAARVQARFKLVFESVPVGISLANTRPDGNVTRIINDAHLQLCGITREQAMVRESFQRICHPDDYEQQEALNRRLNAGEISGFTMEKRYLHPGGDTVWVIFSRQRLTGADGSIEDLTTVIDITKRKQAEMFLASILHHLPISVFIKEVEELRFVHVNKAQEEILGITAEELLGRNDTDLFPEEQAARFKEGDRQALESGRLFEVEEQVMSPHRGLLTFRTRKIPILGDDGRPRYLLGISEDITERKRAAAELEETSRQLLETSRRAGMAEVATSVLHNVGNVLNSVNVSCSVIADQVRKSHIGSVAKTAVLLQGHSEDLAAYLTQDPTGRKLPEYLGMLAERLASEQAAVLGELVLLAKNIDHIKDIVAMQQNHAKVSGVTEIVMASELVDDCLRMNEESLQRHSIRVIREFEEVPLITIEKHKALQILVNLIRNAKHACEDSGRADKQIIVRISSDRDNVRVVVTDNGVGIAPENLTRIFSHGFTTKKDGHGFGLHSGALAAREMGGCLAIHSDGEGTGATFTLELPLTPDATHPAPLPS